MPLRYLEAIRRLMKSLKRSDDFGVGSNAFRIDVRDKVLGIGEYVDDVELENMLHVSASKNKVSKSKNTYDIDVSEALSLKVWLQYILPRMYRIIRLDTSNGIGTL